MLHGYRLAAVNVDAGIKHDPNLNLDINATTTKTINISSISGDNHGFLRLEEQRPLRVR